MRQSKTPRRAVSVLAVSALALAVAPSASAAETKSFFYDHASDKSAWYWKHQTEQGVDLPAPPPEGVPDPTGQRARVPSSQRPDTLSVAVFEGEHERVAALQFDLLSRGVTPGSEISKLVLTIEESTDRNEQPSFRPEDATLQACRNTNFFAQSTDPPDQWKSRPEVDETDCVKGKRNTSGEAPFWRFDLTDVAQPWGEDPFDNFGVTLLGDIPDDAGPQDSWQVNLKVPARDQEPGPAEQEDRDEYKQTRDRVVVRMTFVAGEPDLPPPPPGGGAGGGSTVLGGGGVASTTDFTSTEGFNDDPAELSETATDDPQTTQETLASTSAGTDQPVPSMPPYVWALLPVGLLALAAVRSVILEPVGGTRPDGVIAAIRRRNAERRGTSVREPRDPLVAVWDAAKRGAADIRQMFSKVGGAFSTVARSVRQR